MYEVAASAQNGEQVKLVSFDGSLGYLHNGLYRDPHLPDIITWENISLIMLKVIVFWFYKSVSVKWSALFLQHVYLIVSPVQVVCAVLVMLGRWLKQKNCARFHMQRTFFIWSHTTFMWFVLTATYMKNVGFTLNIWLLWLKCLCWTFIIWEWMQKCW